MKFPLLYFHASNARALQDSGMREAYMWKPSLLAMWKDEDVGGNGGHPDNVGVPPHLEVQLYMQHRRVLWHLHGATADRQTR
jgi:hypothetical protein